MTEDMKNNKKIDKSSIDYIKKTKKNLGDILVQLGSITEAQLQEVLAQQKDDPGRRKLGQLLIEKEYLKEEDMLRALAIQLDLPYYEKRNIVEKD